MKEARKLLGSSSIIFIGTIVGSFFGYLFNMLVGRWLGPSQYGEFTALMSLLMILSVGGGAVLTVTMKYSGELFAIKNFVALNKLFKIFSKYILFFGILLFSIGLAFIKPIAHFFSINHLLPVVITLFNFIFGFLIVVNRGVLQGTQRFLAISATGTLENILRLAIGVVLIKAGFELTGAVSGAVLATIITYFVTFLPLKKILVHQKTRVKEPFKFDKAEILRYTLPALISSLLLITALNVDVILIKHYFSSEEAGIYASVSTIAKIILYATSPIVSVMFPIVSEHKAKGEKHYKIFLFSLLLTLLVAFVILGIYYIAPGKVILVLYGSRYTDFYYLLPQIGFAILLYALINIVANYFLSIKDFKFLPIFGTILLAQIMIISFWHPSILIVVKIMIMTLGLLFSLMMSYYLFTKREQIFSQLRGEDES